MALARSLQKLTPVQIRRRFRIINNDVTKTLKYLDLMEISKSHQIRVYQSENTLSSYIFIISDQNEIKIRFSDHKQVRPPRYFRNKKKADIDVRSVNGDYEHHHLTWCDAVSQVAEKMNLAVPAPIKAQITRNRNKNKTVNRRLVSMDGLK